MKAYRRSGISIGALVALFVATNSARRAADPPPAPIVENARVRVWDVAPGGTPPNVETRSPPRTRRARA